MVIGFKFSRASGGLAMPLKALNGGNEIKKRKLSWEHIICPNKFPEALLAAVLSSIEFRAANFR